MFFWINGFYDGPYNPNYKEPEPQMGPQAPPSNGNPWVSIDENGYKWHWYGDDEDVRYEYTPWYKKGNLRHREKIRITREHQQEAFVHYYATIGIVNTGSEAVITSAVVSASSGVTAVPTGQQDSTDLHNWTLWAEYGMPNPQNTQYGTINGRPNYDHHGLDYIWRDAAGNNISLNMEFRSPYAGTVRRVGYDQNGAGHYIEINIGDGRICTIQHLNAPSPLTVGAQVTTQTIIGRAGSSGNSSGPHVHIGVFRNTPFEGALSVTFDGWTGYFMRPPGFAR